MSWLENLIRPDLRNLAGYSSAKLEAGDFVPSIAIDANESPWAPFGDISKFCAPNRYPDPQPSNLRQRLADIYGVNDDQILMGRGSDDAIDVLLRLFCQAGQDQIMVCPPTFSAYKVYATVQGAETLSVPLTGKDFQLDVPAMLKACTQRTKLIFIPAPNAPMGHAVQREDILALAKARAEKSLIIVDEAYVEFTDTPTGMIDLLKDYQNIAILRTLSKAHALAGERIGCVITQPDIIRHLTKVMAPYPLTQSSIRCALDALSPNGLIQGAERRRVLVAERERMARLLPQSPWIEKVFPSVTNFLLVQTKDSAACIKHLRGFGILPRNRHSDMPNTVRISISTPDDNNALLQSLGINLPLEKTPATRLFSTRRATKETSIDVTVNLDTPNFLKIDSGIGFFDHMLAQLASHGGFGLELHCKGDLEIDQHHTIEDCALAIGEALKGALGNKHGIARFGFSAPLDEAVANVVIDLSGRPYGVFTGTLPAPMIGEMNSEMVPHFFRSLATSMAAAIHVTVQGENAHHMTEAAFKATGRALRQAIRIEGQHGVPSTKGVL
jgi:histidinol-phosphate aminotransferase/imidazoleglycerol-phosphate dehydratase/histidinol-phosphatase